MKDPKRKMLLTKTKIREKFERRIHPSELERKKFGKPLDKKEFDDEFEKDVSIDRTKLDLENAKQPLISAKYLKKYIAAVNRKMRAQTTFNKQKAIMAGEIRKNPGEYGIDRLSETAVQLALSTHYLYHSSEEDYIKAITNFEEFEKKMGIVRERAFILRNLSTLIDSSYFTSTSMSEED